MIAILMHCIIVYGISSVIVRNGHSISKGDQL